MTDRIRKLMEYYHMSPSEFAEKVGAQRSAVSHILSGRNKPGLDFLQKILNAFPEVSADWFILGRGKMILSSGDEFPVTNVQDQPSELIEKAPSKIQKQKEEAIISHKPESDIESPDLTKTKHRELSHGKSPVVKIILLHADNSFSEYYPAD